MGGCAKAIEVERGEEVEERKGVIDIIVKGDAVNYPLSDEEKEIALKILDSLEGNLIIRATLILEVCLKSLQYCRVKK